MGKWKQLIVAGNQLFEERRFDEALDYYQQAKERAHTLFNIWPDENAATASLVVSYHNIADLHSENGHRHLAYSALQDIHDFLSNQFKVCQKNESRRMAVLQGISKADVELIRFLSAHKAYQASHVRPTLRLN